MITETPSTVDSEVDLQIDDNRGDENEVIPFKYSIISYGVDYAVDGLVKRINEGHIFVPSFQRGYVWNINQASKFVESLLLGLPVPGIFLSRESETHRLLVIDGQQRLLSLEYFFEGIFQPSGRRFALTSVQSQFKSKTYKTLSDEDRRRLHDSIIHATVIQQEQPSDDESSIYHIFERLNTGGTLLMPQEIRSCVFHGAFDDLLKSLNQNTAWREIYGKVSPRMRDQELILRFFAFRYLQSRYERPMKEFLNVYMGGNRSLQRQTEQTLRDAFFTTISEIRESIGPGAFRPERTLNAAVFDSIMVGLAARMDKGEIQDKGQLQNVYAALLSDKEYLNACMKATADEESVKRRMAFALAVFSTVE